MATPRKAWKPSLPGCYFSALNRTGAGIDVDAEKGIRLLPLILSLMKLRLPMELVGGEGASF